MPTNDDYLKLRRMTGEVDSSTYTNVDLETFIDEATGDLNIAAAAIWREKASAYADLVNMSEAGSSRSNSDLFAHAKAQQEAYEAASGTGVGDAAQTFTTTRKIVRP